VFLLHSATLKSSMLKPGKWYVFNNLIITTLRLKPCKWSLEFQIADMHLYVSMGALNFNEYEKQIFKIWYTFNYSLITTTTL